MNKEPKAFKEKEPIEFQLNFTNFSFFKTILQYLLK